MNSKLPNTHSDHKLDVRHCLRSIKYLSNPAPKHSTLQNYNQLVPVWIRVYAMLIEGQC